MRNGRWTTDSIVDRDREAVALARKYLTAGTVQGARVVFERNLTDGITAERVIFEEIREVADGKPLRVGVIDHAPWCDTADDLYDLPARMVITRLLRRFLDRHVLTASELLYLARPLQRLQDHDSNICPAAVDRVATVQTRGREDLDIRARRDALHSMVDEVGRRARRAEGEKLMWKTSLADFQSMIRRAGQAAFQDAEQDVLVRASVARCLSGQRSWLGKLETLLGAVSDDLAPAHLAILDGFIADCLGVSEVIQDLLGERPNLASALIGLIDLIEGKDQANRDARSETAEALRALFAERRLPSGAIVVMDRVCREVQGTNPLSRNDPSEENDQYQALCRRVVALTGVFGEDRMAVALTRRYNQRLIEGGDTGWRKSIVAVAATLRESARRLHYLSALMRAREAQPYGPLITDLMVDAIKAIRCVDDLAAGLPPPQKLSTVTSVQRAIVGTHALPEPLTERVFNRFDDMLARYIEDIRLIERLDTPEDPLRQRAERLVAFCGSGVLMEGKALALARKRVISHLRQPNFLAEFVRDVPSEQRDAQVRAFYDRLSQAGFQG